MQNLCMIGRVEEDYVMDDRNILLIILRAKFFIFHFEAYKNLFRWSILNFHDSKGGYRTVENHAL